MDKKPVCWVLSIAIFQAFYYGLSKCEQGNELEKSVVTIDGPAASGKSSVSRELAQRLGWSWVSTGAFYRGIGFVAYKKKTQLDDEKSLVDLIHNADWEVRMTPEKTKFFFEGQDCTNEIFLEEVGNIASQVSHYPEVRKNLLQAQRDMVKKSEGLVAEGRDCGTVVFPEAPVKVYLTASSASRARRRAEEEGASVEKTIEAQKIRDEQDSNRKAAPLQVAEGAHVVDTSDMTLSEVVDQVEALVRSELKL